MKRERDDLDVHMVCAQDTFANLNLHLDKRPYRHTQNMQEHSFHSKTTDKLESFLQAHRKIKIAMDLSPANDQKSKELLEHVLRKNGIDNVVYGPI